jgi:hypothetical protein
MDFGSDLKSFRSKSIGLSIASRPGIDRRETGVLGYAMTRPSKHYRKLRLDARIIPELDPGTAHDSCR